MREPCRVACEQNDVIEASGCEGGRDVVSYAGAGAEGEEDARPRREGMLRRDDGR